MQRNDSIYPHDWFRIGDKEIQRAENLLKLSDLGGAAFNIQQAVEKYLKGYLFSMGWKLRRIHELEILLNEAIQYDSSFEEFRVQCLKMTEYYFEERYPFTAMSEMTDIEVNESLSVALKLINKIQNSLKKNQG